MDDTHPWCLALAGPTAAGKSAAALALAAELPLEIVSVDSALVYRGMDIGTAKPTPAERASVPHHLIDIRDPLQAYSAAEFVRDTQALVREINGRGRLALLVGGTMLYFRALQQGLDDMPPADATTRAALEAEAARIGWHGLHARLAEVDPVTAARLPPQDSQRIQRALEVHALTGKPLSTFHEGTGGRSGQLSVPMVSLEPDQRPWLHARIAERLDAMLAQGLLDEVRALRARGDLHAELPSMRCVGYRQAWEALDGQWPMDQLRERTLYATRQLAKRQITWLRGMPERVVVACDGHDALDQCLQALLRMARAHAGAPR